MQISLKWVNELVNIETVNLDTLIEKLTLGGFEVEETIELQINNQKEIALDISATANRSDSLSIQGISKEISGLLDKPIKCSNYLIDNLNYKQEIVKQSGVIPDEHYCSAFIAMTVENLTDTSIPKWLKQKLIRSGIVATNTLLDLQNYILLETGYPFEFYDLDNILSKLNTSTFDLKLETGNNNEKFLANNDVNYSLEDSLYVVKADNIPISIAGIIPHKEFCYSEKTKSILIEGSIFNSTEIRRKSRQLGLRTDRSARYEKSLKNTNLFESFYKLLSLLRISNPKLIIKLHTFNQQVQPKIEPIPLYYKTIKEILGPVKDYNQTKANFITPEIITNYLDRLDFNYRYDDSELAWKVQIPYARSEDITREIDLVEEIGRLHGFNQFLTRLPKIKTIGNEDSSYQTRKKITSCFLNLGFNELIHYSLVNETTFTKNSIKLINPLTEDYSNLRATLLPSLIKTVQDNLKQGNKSIEGFEFGHVFLGDTLINLEEKEHVAGIFGGIDLKSTWSDQSNPMSWFEAKGKIEHFFNQLNLKPTWIDYSSSNKNPIFHPYCTAELYLSNKNYLGIFGQINPILSKKLNIPFNLYLFEFDFESIQNQIQGNTLTVYKDYSSYPKITKDLSFIINQDISFDQIRSILHLNGTKFLSEIILLDDYRGSGIPENYTSLCLQLIFQSNEKTLENKKVEEILDNLQLILKNKFDVQIRT